MSLKDWEKLTEEWLSLYQGIDLPPTTPGEPKARDYLYLSKVGRGTPKAAFFLTKRENGQEYGFWCPRKAILQDDNKGCVKVAKWCKIKIIPYNRK